MDEIIRIKTPATIANIVCGFDVLGMAVTEPYDEVVIRRTESPVITIRHTDDFGIPEEAHRNVAGVALLALQQQSTKPVGFELEIHKHIMPGSGLGSSAASSAGAVAGANALLGSPFNKTELLRFASEGEKLASGTAHFDNITPCMMGGITLINSSQNLSVTPLAYPELWCSIIHPQIEVKTSDSRRIIKKEIPIKAAIHQWSNIAGLVAGLLKSDYELISRSLEDVIFEPARSILIPGFDEVKNQSKEAGALGGGISGSGPSIFMLSKDQETARHVEAVMKSIYEKIGLDYKTYVTTIKPSPLI